MVMKKLLCMNKWNNSKKKCPKKDPLKKLPSKTLRNWVLTLDQMDLQDSKMIRKKRRLKMRVKDKWWTKLII